MTNVLRTTQPRRARWSMTKRAVVAVTAAAGVALAVLPGAAQASPQAGPQPVRPSSAQVDASSTGGTALQPTSATTSSAATTTATSSWYNTVRYNRIYKYGGPIGISRCHEPSYPLNSYSNVAAWHKAFLSCLNTAWSGNVKKAGFSFYIPSVVFYQSSYKSYCGWVYASSKVPYYCSYGHGQILIPWTVYVNWYKQYPTTTGRQWLRAFTAQQMAHEYGHHIQHITGILDASWNRQTYTFKTTADKLEENRRRELQATCWGGAYLGADRAYYPMTGGLYTQWKYAIYHMGDNPSGGTRDHGSYKNNGFWAYRGFTYHTAGSCITWAVSDAMVS